MVQEFSFSYMRYNTLKKFMTPAALIAALATAASAAPQYPFPQQVTYKYGNTATYVDPTVIQEHFNNWKSAWYADMNNGTARIISPNDSTELTASEGVAYGMLIMVYMSSSTSDHQSEFDKLWAYWKKYAVSSGSASGMNWKINNNSSSATGTGSASDADIDAAVALVMAYKQWGEASYLSDAKTLINWIKSNDMESDGRVKAGSNWNPALNSSYNMPAAFKLFAAVTGETFWETAVTTNMNHQIKCQNATTGLMPDWCDWSSHAATSNTGAQVSGGSLGFFDDAARTPWRMAWGYYWYGVEAAKQSNDMIVNWLDYSTIGHAAMIWPGYTLDGSSPYSMFVTSTYVGGLGLAMATADNPGYYLETVYETLASTVGKTTPTDGKGEKYYPATLNILYMLTMSGNLPNLYDMDGLTKYTQTSLHQPTMPEGELMVVNSGAKVSGYESWGTFADKFGETVMYPDSGSSGIFKQADGTYYAAIDFRIAPEPTYEAGVTLQYPFAGLAISLDKENTYHDLSNVAKIRLTYKSQGVIRIAILDQQTLLDGNEGGESGYYLHPTSEFKQIDIDVTDTNFSTAYEDFLKDKIVTPSWVSGGGNDRETIMKAVRGFKFEPKMQKGGYGSVAISQFDLLDASGNVITDYANLVGFNTVASMGSAKNALVFGNSIVYSNLSEKATIQVFDMNGNRIASSILGKAGSYAIDQAVSVKGSYVAIIRDGSYNKALRIQR